MGQFCPKALGQPVSCKACHHRRIGFCKFAQGHPATELRGLIASSLLKKLDNSVTSVASGEEAVDYMKENRADLMILDMIMDPGIDGCETYKRKNESWA